MTNYSLNAIPDTWTHYEHPWYTQLDLLGNTTNSESPSQQKHKSETTGQKCIKCNTFKPLDSFRIERTRSNWRYKTCTDCRNKIKRGRYKAQKTASTKPNNCELCGDSSSDLVMDHCHETETFRGWICSKCNRGIGSFSDDISKLQEAIIYLENHHTNGSKIEDSTRTT